MGNGRHSRINHGNELFHVHFRSIDIQSTMLADDLKTDRLKKAEQFCRRILELSNQEKFCDVEVKMEAGKVTIWYEKLKIKPK